MWVSIRVSIFANVEAIAKVHLISLSDLSLHRTLYSMTFCTADKHHFVKRIDERKITPFLERVLIYIGIR